MGDPSRDSAAADPSQVAPARLPSLVSKRDNSSVRDPLPQLEPPPSDPPLRLFPSEDVRVSPPRPPSPRDSTTAATTAPRASTTAATTDLNPSTTATSAVPASMAASAAREVATVATVATAGESINTDKEQTGLSVISDIELFLSTLCSLVELLPQPCVLRA